MNDKIIIKGAREHNLKNINIEIPKNQFVVITGVSGSGKSSLAFDTIYSEGQRRYVESLSAYARQFIGQMQKPELDSIEGLSPAISIEQKGVSKNPRSTVGTMTEIYDYMRLLWAHIGEAHCPVCGEKVEKQTIQEIVDTIIDSNKDGDKLVILAPVIKDKKGTHKNLFLNLQKKGFLRVRVNGEILYLEDVIELDKNKRHNIEVVIDRLKVKKDDSDFLGRFSEAVETATGLSEGVIIANINDVDHVYSENFSCPNHPDVVFPEVVPRLFSFNAPFGACEACNGIGTTLEVDENKLIMDENLSLNQGAIYVPGASTKKGWSWELFKCMTAAHNIDMDKPVKELTAKERDIIFNGSTKKFKFKYSGDSFSFNGMKEYEGAVKNLERRYYETASDSMKDEIEAKYMIEKTCKTCNGKRLKDVVLAITVNDKSIIDITEESVNDSLGFFENIQLTEKQMQISSEILKEIKERLSFMINVGLDYLTLARMTKTLSGGESQRIRLATQIGSRLTGVIYVLDEPSIGLHQRDNEKLLATLKDLKDIGNTLIVVEHDEDTMRESDFLIDIGPNAGIHGGEVIAMGTPEEVMKSKESLTAQYLNGDIKVEIPKERRKAKNSIELKNAKGNNLKNVSIKIPLESFTVVTGVSGSGKSTLINQTLFPELFNRLNRGKLYPLENKGVKGLEQLEKVIDIDQSPIGRTPRSNTATYTKLFDDIRDIFAQTKDSKIRGYDKGRFSFNVKGGRCEACGGAGINKIEMNFLPDVYVECEVCKGKRYNRETLEVHYKDKNISDVLNMSVEEAYEFFQNIPGLKRKLETLMDVGMNYIKLGQPATTLSGGEAQRIKLASELSKMSRGKTIYILDEPTTGLHFEDIRKLLIVLNRLVEKGNTVVVIEHNLDVIKSADHIIDVGPEGGFRGGEVIATGTPEEVAKVKKSYTGQFLKKYLK
ncbi:Excinuclease ABC subunit A [Sebaldella termitidis]|uniref:UvrABC system protein A n=1 Tax=Sebaldella termitidis (strain ATCC 33386 / NCTC 11300) TaxID=526218 RepID=D1AJ04_SEBTE|nr:excinuclease ABC subunit UvrA [Sebaldella termitidis]ACZ08692.1 excinuclease ABC, A subunit [Sebaldella termitidis ATCC 33386]SUI24008.1 Excinuclease ABC subunit A [Sebaldella termitidis]